MVLCLRQAIKQEHPMRNQETQKLSLQAPETAAIEQKHPMRNPETQKLSLQARETTAIVPLETQVWLVCCHRTRTLRLIGMPYRDLHQQPARYLPRPPIPTPAEHEQILVQAEASTPEPSPGPNIHRLPKPTFGTQYVEIWSPKYQRDSVVLALLDTGARGQMGGSSTNLILKKYVEANGIPFRPISELAPHERPVLEGLGGDYDVVGFIHDLKFHPNIVNDNGDRERDVAEYLDFFVYDGKVIFGDLLLGRDYCKKVYSLPSKSHTYKEPKKISGGESTLSPFQSMWNTS
jgi:hypothetical protein